MLSSRCKRAQDEKLKIKKEKLKISKMSHIDTTCN